MLNRVALLGVLAVSCTLAQIDIPYQKFVLSNGLTVLVHEDHKAPIVAVNVWYHVGSKNEKPGKTGFAHLYEHLMFGGSENAKGSYIQAMEKIGATNLNGTTNQDRTNYFAKTFPHPRSISLCSWNPTAWDTSSTPSTKPLSTSSAASSRTKSGRAKTSPTAPHGRC